MVPAPPVLVAMLREHHAAYGTAPDGRLFRGTRGGPAQRVALRPCLAIRPRPRPRPRASRQRARPPRLRPAPRRPVPMAERRRRPRPDRRPGREQRRGPVHRLQPLHPRPRRPPQPADQPRPRATRSTWSVPVRGKPAVTPDPATYRRPASTPTARRPRTPSAICTCGRAPVPLIPRTATYRPRNRRQKRFSHWMRRHRKTARGPFLTVAAPAQESFWAGLRPGGQVTFRPVPARTAYSAKGLSAWTPASSKSFTLRVTTAMPCTRAVAAMSASITGMGCVYC